MQNTNNVHKQSAYERAFTIYNVVRLCVLAAIVLALVLAYTVG